MHFFKEPLFHFSLLGVTFFAWFSYLNPVSSISRGGDEIVIDDQDIDRLITQFQSAWQRPPTLEELTGLQDGLLREEVLVRAARALGLDRGDSVVRGRLAQKMNFLTTSIAQSTAPKDDVLREHLGRYSDRFVQPGKIAFQQIGFGPTPDPKALEEALEALNAGADPILFGTPSLLPTSTPLTPAQQIDGMFGRGFFDATDALPLGQWVGPVVSGYGLHLVRIDASQEPQLPEFDDIRDDVLFDWRRELKSELALAQYEELKRKYGILIKQQDELSLRLSQ